EGFHGVREVFDRAEEALDIDIAGLCFEGPQEVLDLTPNTQAAVLTVDVALYRVFENVIEREPATLAGHSLGEYAALCAAGAIDFADAVRLVYARGTYQQEAVPPGEGCMAAVVGLDRGTVEEICRTVDRDCGVVAVANDNSPGQFVISGNTAAVERAMTKAREEGARMVMKLPISVPCHCSLLDEAAQRLDRYLDGVAVWDCRIPVIPNFDPEALHSEGTTRKLLTRQLNAPVRWQETIKRMSRMGIRTIVEVGPKKTLSGLIRRIDGNIKTLNIEDKASLEATGDFFDGGEAA
ncbi:MAG: ACP S-malonyltransferase, partial [Deltaproteobacteria bacterium]|nr:ACP S-malonyltransferase [Deltaproteobacteria bacterium]